MRGISAILLLAYLALLLVPACIVADFVIERDHIVQDLCVQRMVSDGQRTCHGDCYLMKKLGRSEQREKGLPAELRELRVDEAVLGATRMAPVHAPPIILPAPRVQAALSDGCVPAPDPVPWC
jgi:hypothetical protein